MDGWCKRYAERGVGKFHVVLVLRYVFRGLTRNTRLIWLGLWIFFIITWVGQDYFAPQAMAYALYLTCIGLLIRRSITRSMLAAFVVVVSVVAASHQITPMMLLIAVAALVRAAAYARLVPPGDRRRHQPPPGACSPRAATPSRASAS